MKQKKEIFCLEIYIDGVSSRIEYFSELIYCYTCFERLKKNKLYKDKKLSCFIESHFIDLEGEVNE